ncbi:MAG: CidA/LrgA family protein [Pararhodobacter sp.]
MIRALTVILCCQLAGDAVARALGLPIPGPVLGMALLWAGMSVSSALAALVRPAGEGILRHLSLLFVPAGVGVIGHAHALGPQALGLGVAILASTALAIAAGSCAFVLVARLIGSVDA